MKIMKEDILNIFKSPYFTLLDGQTNFPRKKDSGFIAFEGLDGSGKSVQARLFKTFLEEMGFEVILTKEPTADSEAGREVRRILNKEIRLEPREIQKLFVQDRKEHLEKLIIPAIQEGKIVLVDRYFFSTFAFGKADGLDLEWLIEMNQKFLAPDITFLLRVSPEVCINRINKRNENVALFEKKEILRAVWETYKILPNRFKNIHFVEGEGSIENVFEEIKKLIKNLNL
jgi:dTMP kinase